MLANPKHVFGVQNVAPVVNKNVLAAERPASAATLNRVSALLTIPAIQQMKKAVSIDKQSATTVAEQAPESQRPSLIAVPPRAASPAKLGGCGAVTVAAG